MGPFFIEAVVRRLTLPNRDVNGSHTILEDSYHYTGRN
jgi:hypothetical protein